MHTQSGRDARAPQLLALAALFAAFATGCTTVGPDYQRPNTESPPAFKSTNDLGAWRDARPLDHAAKGAWWEVFGDTTLNELERRATTANQQLKAAVARVEQARATARVSKGALLPTLESNSYFRRERYSPNQQPNFGALTANTIRVPLDLSYEVDLWGRLKRGFEGASADAQASLAALHNVQLIVQADVAQNYFTLRALDAELATVVSTIGLRKEQLQLVRSRFEGGVASELDVARAQTELASAEAEQSALAKQRAELEHALAVLLGEPASAFKLPALASAHIAWQPLPPAIPPGLPADLLERRPDVAEAERQLASANARIGVAKSASFPVLRLTGSGGFVSGELENLFSLDSRVWSFGPSLSLPIFAGGRNRANLQRSQAAYEEAVARYRQQVLVAFGEVESSLAGLHHLARQAEAQARAVASARRAAELANERYKGGIVSYLEVVDANRATLQVERAAAQLTGQRLLASVLLIKSLGGGWDGTALLSQATAQPSSGSK